MKKSFKFWALSLLFFLNSIPLAFALTITNKHGGGIEIGIWEPGPGADYMQAESCWDNLGKEMFTAKQVPNNETITVGLENPDDESPNPARRVCIALWAKDGVKYDPFFLNPVVNDPDCKITIEKVDHSGDGVAKATDVCQYVCEDGVICSVS